jgi:hypothetical protein
MKYYHSANTLPAIWNRATGWHHSRRYGCGEGRLLDHAMEDVRAMVNKCREGKGNHSRSTGEDALFTIRSEKCSYYIPTQKMIIHPRMTRRKISQTCITGSKGNIRACTL